jgi:hypothetical protein
MRLVNPSIKVRYAEGKIHRVKIVEFAGLEKEKREKSYGQGESRSVNLAVLRHVQAVATQAPLSTYGMASARYNLHSWLFFCCRNV